MCCAVCLGYVAVVAVVGSIGYLLGGWTGAVVGFGALTLVVLAIAAVWYKAGGRQS